MLVRLLIAMLVLSGANPLRICTCKDHDDEPLLSIPSDCEDGHHQGCHCPILKPVAKLAPAPVSLSSDVSIDSLLALDETIRVETPLAESRLRSSEEHAPATPLYLTLRTLRI